VPPHGNRSSGPMMPDRFSRHLTPSIPITPLLVPG
jgi:hypothetical protein